MSDLDQLLSHVRGRQALEAASSDELRLVLEPGPAGLAASVAEDFVRQHYQVAAHVTSLFGGFGEDADADSGFLLLRLPRVSLRDLPVTPFALAYDLVDQLQLRSAEPDLATDFFLEEPKGSIGPDGSPIARGLESMSDFAFWCWAPSADDPRDRNWALDKIGAQEAWVVSEAGEGARGRGIRVFQPDTGVAEHAELGNDMVDMTNTWDFVLKSPGATDPLTGGANPGHGTGTSSVVASRPDGSMTGSAPEATLVPVRCTADVAVFDQSPVAAAIEFARRKGAHVITMSLGGVWSTSLHAAVRRAVASNVIVLAAAGNCVGQVVWPARYDEVIGVAGVNKADRPWRGSCRGPAVDISAPAEFVPRAKRNSMADPTTLVDGGQGTSFAVALTAGVAALWLAHHGRDKLVAALRPGETLQSRFKALLQRTATVPDGFDRGNYGAGVVNAQGLLSADPFEVSSSEGGIESAAVSNRGDRHLSVRTLVAEVTAPPAGLESAAPPPPSGALNWDRYALEAAYLALRTARARKAQASGTGTPLESASTAPRFPASEAFRGETARLGDPRLQLLAQVR